MSVARVIYISGTGVVAPDDGTLRPLPDGALDKGLSGLIDRIAPRFGLRDDGLECGTILLDTAAVEKLEAPGVLEQTEWTSLDDHWAFTTRGDGWIKAAPRSKTHKAKNAGHRVLIGLVDQIDRKRSVLLDSNWPQDWVESLAMWHARTGAPWRGTPGVTGLRLLRQHLPTYRSNRGTAQVSLRPAQTGPERASERAWEGRAGWRRQTPRAGYLHSYDAVRGYLAAMGSCEHLCPWSLAHTPKAPFDPKRAGWWLLALAPWQGSDMAELLPDPAGPGVAEGRAWVTTPTAVLLDKLSQDGIHGGFEVLDSWTGPGKRILRGYAEQLDTLYLDAAAAVHTGPDFYADDAARNAAAAKALYKEVIGMLAHRDATTGEPGKVYRPDWRAAIIAQHRANLWRRMYTIGVQERRWPIEIDVDNVWYHSDLSDPHAAAPAALNVWKDPTAEAPLGRYRTKGTRTLAVAA